MSFFNKIMKAEKKVEQSVNQCENLRDVRFLNEIWKKEEVIDIIILLYEYLASKCEYGKKIENLLPCEKVFYLCQAFECEINNGGFSQFFFNSTGDFTMETIDSVMEIGALKTAELLKRANSIFPNNMVPKDWNIRRELLEKVLNDENKETLEELDSLFYQYEDNLEELNYDYVILNKSKFS